MAEEDEDLTAMPFVLTEEHGGIYKTEDFSAGWHLGVLDSRLTIADTAGLLTPTVVLRSKWRQQADLIAMAHGLLLKVVPVPEDPDYSYFTFAPPEFFGTHED